MEDYTGAELAAMDNDEATILFAQSMCDTLNDETAEDQTGKGKGKKKGPR